MSVSFDELLLDNPIIVKHIRSRLRLGQTWPAILAIACLGGVITWGGYATGGLGRGTAFYTISGLGMLMLVIGGANQVATIVGSAKESGILDFHRVSPLSPFVVAFGFFLGAPIREYVLFAALLPFLVVTAALGDIDVMTFLNTLVPIFLTAWMFHALALLIALVAKKPKSAAAGVIAFAFLGFYVVGGILAALAENARRNGNPNFDFSELNFYGVNLPRLIFLALYQGAFTTFFLIAATRKTRSERALPFSKFEALTAMATIVVLALGAIWKLQDVPFIAVGLLYVLVIAGMILISTCSPDLNDYLKGVRRARHQGRRRAPMLSDNASNLWAVAGIAAWVLIGATIAWEAIEKKLAPGDASDRSIYSQTIAIGVLTVAYFGFARQYFALRYARRGTAYFFLFLFLAWLMPALIGSIAMATPLGRDVGEMIMAVCPWTGMLLSIKGAPVGDDAAGIIRFLAVLPSVTFAFLFHFLLVQRQRVIDRGLAQGPVRPSREPKAEDDEALLLTF